MRMLREDGIAVTDADGAELFSVCETWDGETMTLKLKGRIPLRASHELEDELTAAATVCDRLVLDFAEVESISGTGLEALLKVQQLLDQRNDAQLCIRALTPCVRELFEDVGFVDLFEIED